MKVNLDTYRGLIVTITPPSYFFNNSISGLHLIASNQNYLQLTDLPVYVDGRNAPYVQSPFQKGEFSYRITLGIPDIYFGRIILYSPREIGEVYLTGETPSGVYSGVYIPEEFEDNLTRFLIIYGGLRSDSEKFVRIWPPLSH